MKKDDIKRGEERRRGEDEKQRNRESDVAWVTA
jgi:hypothetical protein